MPEQIVQMLGVLLFRDVGGVCAPLIGMNSRHFFHITSTLTLLLGASACSSASDIGEDNSGFSTESGVRVAAGGDYCAIAKTGAVVCINRTVGAPDKIDPLSGNALFRAPLEAKATHLAAAQFQTCARLVDGRVSCFPNNRSASWSVPAFPTSGKLPTVAGLDDAVNVATSNERTCATKADGRVACWGFEAGVSPTLGVPANDSCTWLPTQSALPCAAAAQIVPGLTGIASVALGSGFQCALGQDGQVSCWGSNLGGALGDGTAVSRATPALVPNLQGVVQIAASTASMYALTDTGELYAWGVSDEGSASCSDGKRTFGCDLSPRKIHGASSALRISVAQELRADGDAPVRLCELDVSGTPSCSGGGSNFLVEQPNQGAFASFATSFHATCGILQTQQFGCWGRGYAGSTAPEGYDASTFAPIDLSGL